MQRPSSRSLAIAVLLLPVAAACRPAATPAPAPSVAPPPAVSAAPATLPVDTVARRGYVEADVRFLQGMIPHHAQALEMAALVPGRAADPRLALLAERIAVSQRDEIAMMQRWLERRGERVPQVNMVHATMPGMPADSLKAAASAPGAARADAGHAGHHGASPAAQATGAHGVHGMHGAAHEGMPGMLTAAQLAALAAASGPAFDRLFLESMIRHHEGALVMVRQLAEAPGAAQEPELFGIMSDVDADQRAEIARMGTLLRALPGTGSGR